MSRDFPRSARPFAACLVLTLACAKAPQREPTAPAEATPAVAAAPTAPTAAAEAPAHAPSAKRQAAEPQAARAEPQAPTAEPLAAEPQPAPAEPQAAAAEPQAAAAAADAEATAPAGEPAPSARDEAVAPTDGDGGARRPAEGPPTPSTPAGPPTMPRVVDPTAPPAQAAAAPPGLPPVVEPSVQPSAPAAKPLVDPELVAALKKALKGDEFSAGLDALYSARDWQPIFLQGFVPTAGAHELVALVADLPSHAIDPKPYGLANVSLEPVTTSAAAGALEARLGAALMRYVADFSILRTIHPFRSVRPDGRPKFLRENAPRLAEATAAVLPEIKLGLEGLWPKRAEYATLRAALPIWRAKADAERAKGRPPAVPIRRMDPGKKGKDVKALQERLRFDGYYTGELTSVVDEPTMEALKAFQRRHNLVPDGKPGLDTVKRFRETTQTKVKAIELALQRWRESEALRDGATDFLRVNLPGFSLELVENGVQVRTHRVIVGNDKLDYNLEDWRQGHINRTPLLETRLYKVILNPVWIVPPRIRDAEIIPETGKDPRYLSKKGIHVKTMSDGSDKYVMSAGDHNVLGQVKFLLEKTNAVYLHDTDKRKFFDKSERALSHGCMRVDKAVDLAHYLLETRAGKDAGQVDAILERGDTTEIPLNRPLDVYVDYITVGVDEANDLVFYLDVYGYDAAALRGDLPPTAYTRYGSGALKPRGVPLIPQAEYQKLRAQGGSAPLRWPPNSGAVAPPQDSGP